MTTPKRTSTRHGLVQDRFSRVSDVPMIQPSDVVPSDPRLAVIGVLNPTFLTLNGDSVLVVRIDEWPTLHPDSKSTNHRCKIVVPYMTSTSPSTIDMIEISVPDAYDPNYEPVLPLATRSSLRDKGFPDLFLSYISHLRLARFENGAIKVDARPLVFPDSEFSKFGYEDARATLIEEKQLLTYSAIGKYGATSWIGSVIEPGSLSHPRMLLGPDHKHSTLFPERISGSYYMLTRPLVRRDIPTSGIWLMRSPDLRNWQIFQPIIMPRPGMWDSERVGPSASPIRVSGGWIVFYYAVDFEQSYQVGAAFLDEHDVGKVIARSAEPLLSPTLDWERTGRRADTIFPCGLESRDGGRAVRLYYGAADKCVGAADIELSTLFDCLSFD